jgi:hypothetical protein
MPFLLLLHSQVDDCRTRCGRRTDDGLRPFGNQKAISICSLNKARTTQPPLRRDAHGWRSSRARRQSRRTSTSGVMKKSHSQGSDGGLLGDGSLSGLETFQQPMLCRFEDLPNGDETIPDNDQERRFVWEHLNDVHRILHRLRCAGTTVSASKLFIAVPKVVILGHRCNYEGRIPDDSDAS